MKQILLVLLLVGLVACTGCPLGETGDVETVVYGRFKADIASDSDVTNSNGNFVQWVDNVTTGDGSFAITSRETRLGVKLSQGDVLTGKVEVDFYGSNLPADADNKGSILLRHAFVKMDLDNGLSLLAGQTSDVFSPLLPAVLNYGWGWNAGNPGYRRPQFRLGYENQGFVGQLALARSISAEDAGSPDIQARLAYGMKEGTVPFEVGASYVTGVTDTDGDIDLSAFAVDFNVKPHEKVVVRGEYYSGQQLNTYLGSIGVADSTTVDQEIESSGFWVQVGLVAAEGLTLNVGYGAAENEDDYLAGNDPENNSFIFVNGRYMLNEKTELGLEVSLWDTEYYNDTEDYENTRVQLSLIVNF